MRTLNPATPLAPASLAGAPHQAGQQLLDEVRRARRSAVRRVAVALRLSRLSAPRPHHLRVARAVLNDAAQRGGGQVFVLGNTDQVLLLQAADGGAALCATLEGLFRAGPAAEGGLLTRWHLPEDAEALLHEAEEWAATPAQATPAEAAAADLDAIGTLGLLVEDARLEDLVQRQVAVLFDRGGQVLPLYQELAVSLPVLEARVLASGQATADPFLLRHLLGRLDARMLEAMRRSPADGGGLAAGARTPGPALHLNLAVGGILSDGFAPFAAACRRAGARVGIEVCLVDACSDAERFMLARDRLQLAGFGLVLDEVSHHALMLTMPGAFRPDLVKLDWSPHLPEAGRTLDQAVQALGPSRIVLHRADTEAALGWGLAQGIRRFQGRQVDALLAAGRMKACAHAGGCSLRQCTERAFATGPAGRAGCRSPALLDGAPPALAAALR